METGSRSLDGFKQFATVLCVFVVDAVGDDFGDGFAAAFDADLFDHVVGFAQAGGVDDVDGHAVEGDLFAHGESDYRNSYATRVIGYIVQT